MSKRDLVGLTDNIRVNISKVHCRRCNWRWVPRTPSPTRCPNPKCRTPYWKTARVADQVHEVAEEAVNG